jgi:rubredoxin
MAEGGKIMETQDNYGCEICRYHELEQGDSLYQYTAWDSGIEFDRIYPIRYCPVCGKKLPKKEE